MTRFSNLGDQMWHLPLFGRNEFFGGEQQALRARETSLKQQRRRLAKGQRAGEITWSYDQRIRIVTVVCLLRVASSLFLGLVL
ncbi:unnamed protein product [Linum trigynum]|uniref:Uncharacterized protein n=1 Tax=Linum trigynum TaxID=586398 RepID=A0AAV2GSJ5_9ROSI